MPRTDRLVEWIVVHRGAELLAVARAEAMDRRLVEQHLAHRLDGELLGRAGGALRQRVEEAHVLDLVAEEIETQRRPRAGRIKVDDPAAHRIFARLADRIGAAI